MIAIDIAHNLDQLFVGISIVASLILGIIVYLDNRKSITSRTFLLFALAAIFWNVCNYVSYQPYFSDYGLLIVRLSLFFAVWYCYFLFKLFYVFPDSEFVFSKRFKLVIWPAILAVSILTLTPYVFKSVLATDVNGIVSKVNVGPAIIFFVITILGLLVCGFWTLVKKLKNSEEIKHKQLGIILNGAMISFTLHIIFNMVFPLFLDNSSYASFGAIFSLPFIAFTAFAVIKYKLFNVKVIATELLIFTLWIFLLIRTLIANTLSDQIINGSLFFAMVVIGILLIRSVFREVKQREDLEKATNALETANQRLQGLDKMKTEFLSLASHQLRSPITAIKGYTSMLLEGAYGEVLKDQKVPISRVFESSQNLANVVEDLLDVGKIEQGGMKYELTAIDIEQMTQGIFHEFTVVAENKGLKFSYVNTGATPCVVMIDPIKIRQVIINLLDNSIKYTEKGFVNLSIKKVGKDAVIEITDSGIGMSPETKEKLFGKFARGEGKMVNAGGSGLGLYLVKQIVDAHKGTVDATSPGVGKGATFRVTLPLK